MPQIPIKFRLAIFGFIFAFVGQSSPAADFNPTGHHLFILSGQSNMRQPLPDSFEEVVEKAFGADKVIIAMSARPSQPIRSWDRDWNHPDFEKKEGAPPNGGLYDSLINTVRKKIGARPLASVTFIWMQGEADAKSGWASSYEKSFFAIQDRLKSDLAITDMNYVLGRINDYWLADNDTKDGDRIRALQEKIGNKHPYGDWVNTDDLNTGMNPWGLYETNGGHFPNAAYRKLGQRFARKAIKLIDPKIKLEENWFTSPFFDEASDIASHLAIGKIITGTSTTKSLDLLLDGKFSEPNAAKGNWLAYDPAGQKTQWTIDLGSSHGLSNVGLNFLIDSTVKATLPISLLIETSVDGESYQSIRSKGSYRFFYGAKQRAKGLEGIDKQALLVCAEVPEIRDRQAGTSTKLQARYIRMTVDPGDHWIMVDELIVNPKPTKKRQ